MARRGVSNSVRQDINCQLRSHACATRPRETRHITNVQFVANRCNHIPARTVIREDRTTSQQEYISPVIATDNRRETLIDLLITPFKQAPCCTKFLQAPKLESEALRYICDEKDKAVCSRIHDLGC